ncbi:MAG TPA: hypothetical protein DD473_28355 [Planctomycetaceae bacterium]|nr:hypothetical protein [Planctomycetaceae bacterium]
MNSLKHQFDEQRFTNGYELVNGVAMHQANGEQFQIPPDVIKRNVALGQFVELRIDSPRFSVHEDDVTSCTCPSCNGELSKPILRHEHPESLLNLPSPKLPSRGWGEDFWVQIQDVSDKHFRGVVDNHLAECHLHGLDSGSSIYFHADHILALHDIHKLEIVESMSAGDLKEFAQYLGSLKKRND